MALPTAQLGQLSQLSVPYSIPTTLVDKRPRIWQQALASFLTNAASQAGQAAVSNEFEKENAPAFGQKATPWYQKFYQGAAINDKEAMQLRDIKASDDQRKLIEAGLDRRSAAEIAGALNRTNITEAGAKERLGISEAGATGRTTQTIQGEKDLESQKALDTLKNEDTLARLRDELSRTNPEGVARTNLYNQEAAHYGSQAEINKFLGALMQKRGASGQPTTPAVNPTVPTASPDTSGPSWIDTNPKPGPSVNILDMLDQLGSGSGPGPIISTDQMNAGIAPTITPMAASFQKDVLPTLYHIFSQNRF